ncbi:uncharacterized protein BKA55DRAFT_638588 [Fusarium redolens]|uniref:DUF7702 domain-containing protein n=1 Tax=Fusarium redolens TaxID=48865 RepID=A0A9P9HJX5_FUSRE|nr:uncharacterized protein BKA55DRAFT_638588 [Fusarium redolens]KAH7258935.1 hypothetical protein BKA55DRAFT_638588 [Fusarium redolens]
MLSPHTSVGIAQVVFYALVLPIAVFVLIRNWKHGLRLASYPLVTFSLARLAGGILTILRQSDPTSLGLIIATTVLLNVGLIPLMISMVGFIRLIMKSSLDENKRAFILLKIIRFAFIAAIALLCVAGALSGSNIHISRHLTQAGYVTLAVVLGLMTVELLHLYTQKHRIAPERHIFIQLTLASIPTLALRTVYGLLCAFTVDDMSTIWNSLVGSAVAFALMCLLAEYITLLIFLYLGIHHWRGVCAESLGSVEMESLSK